jgi:hypothetical protein
MAPAHPTPDEWGSETVSAVNSRTKYSPYKRAVSATPTLDSITQERMVHRLYNVAVNTKEKNRADILDRFIRRNGEGEHRSLTAAEQQDLGDRLYYRQRAHTQRTTLRLKELYCPERAPSRKLTREDLNEQGKRLYYDTVKRSESVRQQLMVRYVESTDVKTKKLSLAKIAEMATRLSAYKKE